MIVFCCSQSLETTSKTSFTTEKLHEDINFTMETSYIESPFLNVKVKIVDGLVGTDIFY